MPEDKTKVYLEYLDKEMTIMGIMTAFCLATVAFILNSILTTDFSHQTKIEELWNNGYNYIIAGSVLLILAARLFYKQRADIAVYYGQICICIVDPKINDEYLKDQNFADTVVPIERFIRFVDSWGTWVYYRVAFGLLYVALIEFMFALLAIKPYIDKNNYYLLIAPIIIGLIIYFPWMYSLMKYKYVPNPYKEMLKTLFGKKSSGKK